MSSQNFTDDQRRQLSPTLEDILYSCSFNGQPCNYNDFVWEFDKFYGNCFVFNSGISQAGDKVDLKKSHMTGNYLYGLQLTFYVGFNDLLSILCSQYGKGGFVKIENATFLDATTPGFYLKPGKYFFLFKKKD